MAEKYDKFGYKLRKILVRKEEKEELQKWFEHFFEYQKQSQYDRDLAYRCDPKNYVYSVDICTEYATQILWYVYDKICKIKTGINNAEVQKISLTQLELETVHLFLSNSFNYKPVVKTYLDNFFNQIELKHTWTHIDKTLKSLKTQQLLPMREQFLLTQKHTENGTI